MGDWRDERGFTLIELIIVLVIIAIIASISLGTLVNTKSRSPQQFMQDIYQLFSLASNEASITGKIKGLLITNEQLELYNFSRASTSTESVANAFGGLLSSITNVSGGQDNQQEEEFSTLEDRGAFSVLEKPSWSSEPIYTLNLPDDYQINLDAMVARSKTIQPDTDDDKDDEESEDGDEDSDKKQAEPQLRFFPDGGIVPAGAIILVDKNTKFTLSWDNGGNLRLEN